MNELKITELDHILKESASDKLNNNEQIDRTKIQGYLEKHIIKRAVLGFDIYQYSQYSSMEQTLIPHLFKKLYSLTIKNCIDNESFFFQYKTKVEFENQFVDTGDGGFQIFETPFEALIFSIYFQANIVRYNSGNKVLSDLYHIIGEISLRYSLTFDHIFNYQKNFYGPAIINCARIMSKDKLNRFLLDHNSIIWFNNEINSIETCVSFEAFKDFPTIPIFKSKFNPSTYKSMLFSEKKNQVKSIDILKIGEIQSKQDSLYIFSAHIQVDFTSNGKLFKKYRISLGNLNSSGLTA